MEELNWLTVEAYKASGRMPLVVVLDNVRSGHNVGSVFRTCDAFGIPTIYLCGITPCPPNREVLKTALGSTESVAWFHFPDTKTILEELKQQDFEIVLAEHTTESISLQDFNPGKEKNTHLYLAMKWKAFKVNYFIWPIRWWKFLNLEQSIHSISVLLLELCCGMYGIS